LAELCLGLFFLRGVFSRLSARQFSYLCSNDMVALNQPLSPPLTKLEKQVDMRN
jgi:hypothetical protein